MNYLDNARKEFKTSYEEANMSAFISQAESLAAIADELTSLGKTMRLIASLEAEIVLDIHTRRAAERASYAAYHQASVEAEEGLKQELYAPIRISK